MRVAGIDTVNGSSLPLTSIDRLALETRLRQIGTMEGTTNAQGKSA
jgi:arsenate reductase (thioredoxin)